MDCTTLPDGLIENELFGHEKGAFTGADKTVPGKFEVAHRGTLFIDEIGELPLKVQGKLLRVLQDREFERVGGTTTIQCDIRIICATHRNLWRMVKAGEFREDLYYRVRVVPIALPPLRERDEDDKRMLTEHFISKFSRLHHRPVERLTDSAWEKIKTHAFPGNIRELENSIESAVVLCDDGVIHARDVRLQMMTDGREDTEDAQHAPSAPRGPNPHLTLHEVERAHIQCVLEACAGNRSEAARRLGIGRNTLARKLAG